jgi:hypothetical protein
MFKTSFLKPTHAKTPRCDNVLGDYYFLSISFKVLRIQLQDAIIWSEAINYDVLKSSLSDNWKITG